MSISAKIGEDAPEWYAYIKGRILGITVIPAYRVVSTFARKAREKPYDEAAGEMERGLREYVRSLLSMLHPSISELGERSVIAQFGDPEPEPLLEALTQLDAGNPKEIVDETLARCSSVLSRPDLNARAFLFPGDGESRVLVKQMHGVLGFSLGSQAMVVFLWPTENWQYWLAYTAAHEYAHLVRNLMLPRSPQGGRLMYVKSQTPETLLDAMVAEGIADHFATRMSSNPPPPWTDALTAPQATHLWPRVRRRLEVSDMNEIRRVLFGDGDRIPTWTGYTLGYRIVNGYLQNHPAAQFGALVGLSGKAVFEGSGFPNGAG